MKGLGNLVVLVLVVAAGYYGYTKFSESGDSSNGGSSAQSDAGFNCRGAKAALASRYQCRSAPDCSLSSDEESELRKLEADIDEYC